MKADLSRDTFDPAQHYSAVRLQQGRVVTDADWNEQADIGRYRAQRQTLDIIGPCGGPLDAAGYGLLAETNACAVLALDADRAWVAAEDGALLVTTNGGADWTLADLGASAHLRAMATAGGVGWVVGDKGLVRRTENQGLTWSAQDAGTPGTLRGLAAVDADHVWAVGDGGLVVATTDGGVHWHLAQTEAARLDAVHFVDALNGLAVGQGGAILTTADGGETWTGVASGTGAHLLALARFGSTRVWAVGSGGVILHSEDGGASWSASATPVTVSLHAVAFRDQDEGWAAGEGGALLHSLDGGVTWQQEGTGAGQRTLRGLSAFAGEPAWAVGDGSIALRLGATSAALTRLVLPAVNLSIQPGRYYLNGVLCELESACTYANQSDGGAAERLVPGTHLLYLDVWQHHVSALEAPEIREVALGGPDTATRERTLAQVRALPLPDPGPGTLSCDSPLAAWDALVGASPPRLAARAELQLAAANLCEIAASAGYRRLENQLYRVEVHEGGASPTFKWSRDNGSVTYGVLGVSVDTAAQRTVVRLAARGRDSNLDLAVHDRLELIDDEAALTRRAGTLLEYLADGDDALELVLAGVPPGAIAQDPARHPVLRRWDHKPTSADTQALPIVPDTWIDLEDGVQVRFEPGGVYRPGDYWQIPARTITGDVEWPRDGGGNPLSLEPAGIADAYCRLGLVQVGADGTVTVISDCRELFPPLTALEQLLYVSGDGQDAAPGDRLPQPLELRVSRGTRAIAGAPVRFLVETGDGRVGDSGGTAASLYETTTDETGGARCRWTLGPGATAPARYQRVRASLLDGQGDEIPGQTLVYCATATATTAWSGGGCAVTIGPGGQFDRLDSELLATLLERNQGRVCVCLLPGTHEIDTLVVEGGDKARLSLHGCGPTALLRVRGGLALGGLAAVELRDFTLELVDREGVLLRGNTEVSLSGVTVVSREESRTPGLFVAGAERMSLTGCTFGVLPSSAVLVDIGAACTIAGSRFDGSLSFYGPPGEDLSRQLIDALFNPNALRLSAKAGRLHLIHSAVGLLTIGEDMTKELLENRRAGGLFQTAVLQGNTFGALGNVFASGLLSFDGNSFVAEPRDANPYGALIANRSAAAGNVALRLGDEAVLFFLTPPDGGFSGAANQVFILPQQ